MASSFQAAALVASPSYPNSVAWSDENLVAVASGHLVTILNPALPFGPRGLITIPISKPFPIGVIERTELLSGCLLPTCLSRDLRPCVRSISWSPIGLASNSGCLLAVCTTEGCVKVYRSPFCEFSAEWVELMDISEMLYSYLANINFGELDITSSEFSEEHGSQLCIENRCSDDLPISALRKDRRRRRQNALAVINKDSLALGEQSLHSGSSEHINHTSSHQTEKIISASKEVTLYPCSLLQEGSSVEVFTQDGNQHNWVAGLLDKFNGTKALVIFSETDGNGKWDEWVEMDPPFDTIGGPSLHNDSLTNQENCFPKIRPCMNVGKLPEQILLGNCQGVEEILKIGQPVEALINDRWFCGTIISLTVSGLQVKLSGNRGSVTLDASSVRLAPLWITEQKLWQATAVKIEMKCQDLHKVIGTNSDNLKEQNLHQIACVPNSKTKLPKKVPENCGLPFITADQYASRSAMLSSLVIAWSPILELTSEFGPVSSNNSSNCCSILAVGGRSGKISFWKIRGPQYYSIMQCKDPTTALLIGIIQAHNTWITTISWALIASDSSNPQLILATGSSDGSVKIWQGYCGELLRLSEFNHAPFFLLKEVTVDSVPVSIISLIIPAQGLHKMLLAVGKGSGSFELWTCDISASKYEKTGSYDAHDHVVTGLAWAFDGCCLYSCSQDNSVRSWTFHGNSVREVPFPSNTPGVKSSTDVPNASDACFGLAVSPGNLVVAVVRSFDVDLLNQMYQARAQKAAVEFFWIGGQQLDFSSNRDPDFDIEAFPGIPEKELFHWEYNILWSLSQYEHPEKPLVIWDIVAALLAFKQSAWKFVGHIIHKCMISYMGSQFGLSDAILSDASRILSKMTSRQLHLLSIISRRVVLTEPKADKINGKQRDLKGLPGAEEEQLNFWMELLPSIERELQERLVGFSFSAALSLGYHPPTNFSKLGYWHPVGLAQMEQWVAVNHNHVKDHLKDLASEVGKLEKSRLHALCEYVAEEKCSYCSASVPFESVEAAFCQGVKCDDRVGQRHKLVRCAVSMQVCPTTPSWFCTCCLRWAFNLAPETLFTLPRYPSDFKPYTECSTLQIYSRPLCPFCGILLQRSQPEFLLAASPV